eukprot:TRINITY_DN10256_c0_g1_i1.p1 TRINITY_DN10256_c0_g1~~TRINITY_DN10256_c0_g1_i1.p1  ORF type:complete len:382 (+),score=130.58 TRINITY_DN10256_c0_g1_i1:128-1147(+)
MDALRLCPACRLLREQMVALHCCGAQLCLQCLHSTQHCPACATGLLQRHHSTEHNPLDPAPSARPPAAPSRASLPLLRCPHAHCSFEPIDLLMPKHVLECDHAPASSAAPAELPVLAQALPGRSGVASSRDQLAVRANVFKHFMGYDNIARSLKASGSGEQGSAPAAAPGLERSVIGADGRAVPAREADESEVRFDTKHMVMPTDTIEGLALAYGCHVSDIRKRNKLFSGSLIGRLFLVIPASKTPRTQTIEEIEEVLKKKLVGKFKQLCKGSTREEAEFYLESALYELSEATREYNGDAAWEGVHGPCARDCDATPASAAPAPPDPMFVRVLELLGCA